MAARNDNGGAAHAAPSPKRVLHYTAARALERGAALLEAGWSKGANARTDNNTTCSPLNPLATCFCLQGAMMRGVADITGCRQLLADGTVTRYDRIYLTAKRAMRHDLGLPSNRTLSEWNDKTAPTAEYVAHMMRRAAYLMRLRARMRRRPEGLAGNRDRNAI